VKLTDHSPSFGTKVKSEWNYVYSPPYALIACMRKTLDNVICIVNSLQVGRCRVGILAEPVGFSHGSNVQTGFGAHSAS